MGELVLSSFLSLLMSGGRKFKSNVTGCTLLCFQQMGHREGCGEKHQKKKKKGAANSESNEMREGESVLCIGGGR